MPRITPLRTLVLALALILVVVAVVVAVTRPPAVVASQTLFGDAQPRVSADPDRRAVEVGVRFSAAVNGQIRGIRFFKTAENTGPHVGSLWDDGGRRLATLTFDSTSEQGWQQAEFAEPVQIQRGRTYVASYLAPQGRIGATNQGFAQALSHQDLTVPAGGGVFRYGGGFPTAGYQSTNYYVDVLFTPQADRADLPPTSGSPAATAPTPETPAPTQPYRPSDTPLSRLPKVPWEGADYWAQFPKAKAAGWADPTFFPIAVWWSVAETAEDVAFDKALGLNTYVVTNPEADYRLIEDGGLFWVGGPIPGATDASPNWVGTFLDDEVDGRFEPEPGFALLKERADASPPSRTGRFRYANYTSQIITRDRPAEVSNRYVNDFTELVSLDQYFYSVPQCDAGEGALRWKIPKGSNGITPANCRTASSYGKTVSLLREADATDGKLQALWQFVEVVGDDTRLDRAKVQGAAMSSIIHGARGIIWFPQSFSGGCETGNAFRTYQVSKPDCLASQVEGVRTVNALVEKLAPVLNTQSTAWDFGPGIDATLKVHDGAAYVIAMAEDGVPGAKTFTLPRGIAGATVEVVGENRSLEVRDRTFTDTFAAESSYHIYTISVRG